MEFMIIMWLGKDGEWHFSSEQPCSEDVDFKFIPTEVEIKPKRFKKGGK